MIVTVLLHTKLLKHCFALHRLCSHNRCSTIHVMPITSYTKYDFISNIVSCGTVILLCWWRYNALSHKSNSLGFFSAIFVEYIV